MRAVPHFAVVIACEPLKLVPLILLAVCNVVAVNAFPVQDPDEPDTFPVTLPVTLPTTSPFKSPVKPLTKRAAPLTIKSSVVIESALVEPCKDILFVKILAPVIVCVSSVVTKFVGFPLTLFQSTDFAVSAVSDEVACSTLLIVTLISLPSEKVNIRAASVPDTPTTAAFP